MNFKKFILTEEAKAKHALKFFQYEEHEHDEITKKLKKSLVTAWSKIASKYEPLNSLTLDITAKKTLCSMEVDEKNVRVGRFGNKAYVEPSVKIGGAYSKDIKSECKKALMKEAFVQLEKIATSLNASEGLGDVKGEPFSVHQEDNSSFGDIRLKFRTGEFNKTVFLVAIDPGYKFERVYLRDFLSK